MEKELIYERLKSNLVELKLDNIHSIIDNYIERAIKDDLSLVEVLDHLFQVELEAKLDRRSDMRIKMAGFPYRKTLDDFDFTFQPSIDQKLIKDFSTLRFVENKENILFLGSPGVGKTHLAIALGIEAAKMRYTVYYISCHKLIEDLKMAHYHNQLDKKLKALKRYRILIIDEIGYLPLDLEGANLFFQLIARRYEKNSTIITTNKPFSKWGDIFTDNTIAAAILDRLLHHSHVVNITGNSYRVKDRKEFMSRKNISDSLLSSSKT